MIDIHSHLIPGVDDGSQSLAESIRLLKQAEEEGITEIITTPHFMKNGDFRIRASELIKRFDELREVYQGSIKLHLGNELYIHPDLPELLEKREILTLAESNYILVEFPFHNYREDYDEILYELSLKYQIIIAHPERYSYVQEDPNFCLRWLKEGYLLQSNQNSLFKKEIKKVLIPMIEHGFISFIASDAHNKYRDLTLKNAMLLITSQFGAEIAELLSGRYPKAVINNLKLKNQEYKKIKKKSFLFWS